MSVTNFLILVLIFLVTLIYFYMKKSLKYWQNLGIACEEPHLIFGSLKNVVSKYSFNDIWLTYYKKFKGTGPFAGFYWFQRAAVFILDKELIKNILIKDFNKFTDRGFYSNEEDDPLTGQLFLLDGQRWRHMRNKLSPTFTSGKMKFMFPIVLKVGEEFINVFQETVMKDSVVEVKDLLARFTTDVIGTCAFGIECSSLRDPNCDFRKMGKKSLNPNRHNPLGIAFMSSYPELAKKLHFKSNEDDVEEFFLRIVRETIEVREKNNIRRNDFMDMLIDLKKNKNNKLDHENDINRLTLEQITAQAFVFFNAGFETSSTTMGFALYELAKHEDIQQRAREEVLMVLEKHDGKFTYECMKEMQYLEQIMSETLRLYTVLPILNRKCLEDYEVPGHPKYVIKKNMPVLIPISAIHSDPDYYPDPEVFNPDNFLPEIVASRDSILFLPFGDGPRNCVGLRFGKMQAVIGLALLLKNFKFSVCTKTQIPMEYDKKSFLISSKEGIFLKVENAKH